MYACLCAEKIIVRKKRYAEIFCGNLDTLPYVFWYKNVQITVSLK